MTVAEEAEAWVWLARIRRPQGRKGEVFAEILTDFPEKFAERRQLWLLPRSKRRARAAALRTRPCSARAKSSSSTTGCTRAASCCTLPAWIRSARPRN